jgi:GTP-binding protein
MFKVSVIGRPNVGKSTLVNRCVGKRIAITQEKPGITRDRKSLIGDWCGTEFEIIDTGGWIRSVKGDKSNIDELNDKVSDHALIAAKYSDVIVFVVDVSVGLQDEDKQIIKELRKLKITQPVVVAVNKVDNDKRELDIWEFVSMGFQKVIPVSAISGRGFGDFLDALIEEFSKLDEKEEPEDEVDLEIAIAGRPNVGKSTLFNALVGESRSIVHDIPGTTRDVIDLVMKTDLGSIKILDTAGIRKKTAIDEDSEFYSSLRAYSAIDQANMVLLVIDATEGVTRQDNRLIERVIAGGSPIVVVLNKWDLLDTEQRLEVRKEVVEDLSHIGFAPILTVSALSKRHVSKIIPELFEAKQGYELRIPTSKLVKSIGDIQREHSPPLVRGVRPRILYATQGAVNPPTFILFSNVKLPDAYKRFIERRLREEFKFGSTPIKVKVKVKAKFEQR